MAGVGPPLGGQAMRTETGLATRIMRLSTYPKGNLTLLARHTPGTQPRPDQGLVAADRRLNQAAPSAARGLPPR
jgi:hypothetical protein